MKLVSNIYTTESVLKGHPDKICDQISDGLLDSFLEVDSNAKVAIECLGTNKAIVVAGEVDSRYSFSIENKCEQIYNEITGLTSPKIINLLTQQSSQLRKPIENGRAGDQGIMYGFACDTRYNYLPYGYWIANNIAKRLDVYRDKTRLFLPDGKIQVYVVNGSIEQLTINVQHEVDSDLEILKSTIEKEILYDVQAEKIFVNEDEGFISGGFENDTGVTGRKIMVDTYGGIIPHGGGGFSGKDPSKLDRSAAYMCRFVAKNMVANSFAKQCLVSVAYDFGKAYPIMLNIVVDGEASTNLNDYVKNKFDFRPEAIIEFLDLKKTKYLPTARYGHFTDENYPWEKIVKL